MTIIIAACRYSAALACAIESVLQQTHRDFELLVVGDGPDAACESIAASFADARVVWKNLPAHAGGPSAPRNLALEQARGTFIAYLDQDDVWHPTHLESCLRTARAQNAEVVLATALRYGVPRSGLRQVSGIFPEGRYTADLYAPASSLFHHRDALEKIGRWTPPLDSRLPVDGDFLSRLHLAKCVIAASGVLSVFTFPSRWRQDCYIKNEAPEQRALLERMKSGEDLCAPELMEALRSLASGEGSLMRMPNPHIPPAQREATANRVRGLGPAPETVMDIGEGLRLTLEGDVLPHEWHPLERNERLGSFRWSGPGRRASLRLPVAAREPVRVELKVLWFINPEDAEKLQIFVGGVAQEFSTRRDSEGIYLISFPLAPAPQTAPHGGVELELVVPRCYPPQAFDINADVRFLGLALNTIDITPLTAEKKEAA